MYVFEYFLVFSIISSVISLRIYWPVASCLWLVSTALLSLPFISFSQGTIFAYLIGIISLRGVFVLLLYMCLLREVSLVEIGNTSFWFLLVFGLISYLFVFREGVYYAWQNCVGLYNDKHVVLLEVELLFLLILLLSSAIILSLHGPSRET